MLLSDNKCLSGFAKIVVCLFHFCPVPPLFPVPLPPPSLLLSWIIIAL